VNDISPNTNNGTLNGGAGFDSTYKAFTFDGTDDYIRATIPGVSDDYIHSISMWVKFTAMNDTVLEISGSTRQSNSVIGVYIDADGTLAYYFYDNDARYHTNLLVNQWYHIGLTYSGSGKRNVYINGIESRFKTSYGDLTQSLTLAGGTMTIGNTIDLGANFFNGSIANFRLYSKALNADQVKELYDYQKDYFLGSKSQVTLYKGHLGVGVTEPSGQLELAGDERIQEYPPGPMDGYETLIPGHGVFCAYASSAYSSGSQARLPYNAFDKASGSSGLNDIWQSVDGLYNGGSGTNQPYTGSVRLAENLPKGHYLGLKMPYPVKITSFIMGAFFNSGYRAVGDGLIVGRNTNNPTWEVVHTLTNSFMAGVNGFNIATNAPAILITTPSIPIDNTKYYDEYALVINGTLGGSTVSVSEWKLFGTPGPTTLDKGSLSLTRSLDVPRVSRYDVDTETPRPEKLLVDFDTTVNSSPTDISGRGNHGVFRESASYSPADKAFNLDGTNKNIRAELNNTETGNQYHSVSLWFKILSGRSSNWRNIFECGENPRSGTSDISLYIPGGQDKLSFTNGVVHMYSDTLTNLYFQWHHIVLTYDGANRNMYLDGALIKTLATTSWAGVANMSLTLGKNNASSAGGEGCDCHVSNFKLYWQTALEPSEVQKLYRLGRTGRSMVISDTAVGIGKVPEAQLDVRGVANFGSRVGIGTTNPLTPLHVNGRIKAGSIGLAQVGNFSLYSKKVGRNNGNVSFTFDIPYTGNWQPGYFIIRAALNDTNSGDSYGWSYGASFRTYLDANYDLVSTIEGANPGATFFETSRSGGVITITALAAGRDFVTATCELLSYAGIEND
jgi:hypothetical protein